MSVVVPFVLCPLLEIVPSHPRRADGDHPKLYWCDTQDCFRMLSEQEVEISPGQIVGGIAFWIAVIALSIACCRFLKCCDFCPCNKYHNQQNAVAVAVAQPVYGVERFVTVTLPVDGGEEFKWTIDGKELNFTAPAGKKKGDVHEFKFTHSAS